MINDLRDDYIKTALFHQLGGGFIFIVPIALGIFLTPYIFHIPATLAAIFLAYWTGTKNRKVGIFLAVIFLLAAILYTGYGIYTIIKTDLLIGTLRTFIGLLEIIATGFTAGGVIKDRPVV